MKDGDKLDSERFPQTLGEVGRALLDASEVRRLVKHRQAVAIIGNALPVRLSYPPFGWLKHAPLPLRERKQLRADATPASAPPVTLIVGTINRPALSFAQLLPQLLPKIPPEYDPARLDPLRDPAIDDGTIGKEG
ncbi:MAG: hypothetical protein HOP19_20885 [Acidobacteria bacterium]|nr:hypothetical protein [Acidobacteriota bacterium]